MRKLDQSDSFQFRESGSDLMARRSELHAEVVFDQSFARPQAAKNDLMLDLIDHQIRLVRAGLFFQRKCPF
jgi:hypothetical protein